MNWWDPILEWAEYNWGYLIILALVGWYFYNKQREKKKEKKGLDQNQVIPMEGDNGTFYASETTTAAEMPSSNLEYYQSQKAIAERWVAHLRQEGKRVALEEQRMDQEYRTRKANYQNKRKILGLKYTNYANQLQSYQRMIDTEQQLLENQKK